MLSASMAALLLVAIAVGFFACNNTPQNTSIDSSMTSNEIAESHMLVQFTASPQQLSISELDAFLLGVSVTNQGTVAAAADAQIAASELYVNGERNMSWMLAVSNGTRSDEWLSLPPGETVSIEWPLGNSLFSEPGSYTLQLRLQSQQLEAIEVEVTP